MGKPRTDLTAAQARDILRYDPDTERLYWLVNRPPRGFAGEQAGFVNKKGYYVVSIGGLLYLGSRLAHLIQHGAWPSVECKICGTAFVPYKITDNLCSEECRAKSLHARDVERAPRERERRNAYAAEYRAKFPEKASAAIKRVRSTPEGKAKKTASDALWYAENTERARAINTLNYRLTRENRVWAILLRAAKARAKKRNQPFDLTPEWAAARWTGRCELSGIAFSVNEERHGKLFSPSIDKVNPKLGYTQSNCRFILFGLNAFKHDGTDDEIEHIATAFISFRKATLCDAA